MRHQTRVFPVPDKDWRFLNTGPGNAAWNMALDEALLSACLNRCIPPIIRVYGWAPPAVSIGYGQQLDHEIDAARCKQYGIDIVRRQTGGRMVLHDQELAYSLFAPQDRSYMTPNAYDYYCIASEALILALEAIGIKGCLVTRKMNPSVKSEGACFTDAARYEIAAHGKKIVGSAQRRVNGAVLQHGSLLMGPAHMRLPLLLPSSNHETRQRMMLALNTRTISVSEILGRDITFEDMAIQVKFGFEKKFGVQIRDTKLTDGIGKEAQRLMTEKYSSIDWNEKRACHGAS